MLPCQKHLLVDGWNVIHSDPQMKRAFSVHGQEGAKKLLSDRLAPIHDIMGCRVTIVYDGRGDDINVERIGRSLTFSEVYTPSSMSADELIEQLCANSKDPNSLIVASRDNLVRLTAKGFRVETITSDQLLDWASRASKELGKETHELKAKTARQWKETSPLAKLDEIVAVPLAPKKRKDKKTD